MRAFVAVAWHRAGFHLFWRFRSRSRIHGELLTLGFDVSSAMAAGIRTMVDETKTIFEEALPLAKKQRPWLKTRRH
jgi:hypothetical protein